MNIDNLLVSPDVSDSLLVRFAQTFGSNANTLLAATGWVTYVVGPELRIKHFLALGTNSAEQDDYEHRFAALDPLAPMHCLAKGHWVASLDQMISPTSPEHREYQSGFLNRHRIVDAIEIFLRSDAGIIVGCSLLRHGDTASFSEEDLTKALALKTLGDFALSQTFPRHQASVDIITQRFQALTPREAMLVQLVAAGLNNKQLCRELNISLATVKTHLLNVFRKMEVASRTELAAKVLGYQGTPSP